MPISINGSGTITGISAGGLENGIITPSDLSTGAPFWGTDGTITAGGQIWSNGGSTNSGVRLNGSVVQVFSASNRHVWFYNSGGGSEGIVYSEAANGNMHVYSQNGTDLIVHRDSNLGCSSTYWRSSISGGRMTMTTGNLVNFHWNGGFYYNIDNNAYVLINASPSDVNLKNIEGTVNNATDLVMALNPVRFSYKEDCPIYVGNDSRYGFIAQELQEILPELVDEAGFPKRVTTSPDEEIEDPGTYLRYADDASKQLIAILTKALQESISKIESLESRISALESNQ